MSPHREILRNQVSIQIEVLNDFFENFSLRSQGVRGGGGL